MDPLSRSEILQIILDMGIDLPKGTKLKNDTLEKRIRDALNASQNRESIPIPLSPSKVPAWPMMKPWDGSSVTGGRSISQAVRRSSYQEMTESLQALRAGRQPSVGPLYVNALMDLRQTMMSIGNILDNGARWCVLQDPKCEKYAINIRFLSILEVEKETPAVLVLYRLYTRFDGLEGIKWCQRQYERFGGRPGRDGVMMITATPLEMKLLLKLFAMNSKLLPQDYTPERDLYEEGFNMSVLLPLGTLSFDALGRLNNDTGCVICEKERRSRCSQCQSVSYCGADCQKADWSAHKQSCRSLEGGRWSTITFRTHYPGCERFETEWLSRRSVNQPNKFRTVRTPSSGPPPNVHGEKVFLVKLQDGMGRTTTMLIYDRHRSFNEVFFLEADDPATHADVLAEIRGPRGGYEGQKMYRWAKRTGDYRLRVCLDRGPAAPIMW